MKNQWTEELRNIVRINKHLSAAIIHKNNSALHQFTVKAVQRVKDNLRGEHLANNGKPLTKEERTEMLRLILLNESTSVLSAIFQRKPDEINKLVCRIRKEENLLPPGKLLKKNVVLNETVKLQRAPKINIKKTIKGKVETPIKQAEFPTAQQIINLFIDNANPTLKEQFLNLLIDVLKNTDVTFIEGIRKTRNQNNDNPLLVSVFDYLGRPQAKDLSPNHPAKILCKRLRLATEHFNRILRNIPSDKSANVSTFQYNQIRHICGIRITSFTDCKMSSLGIELQALSMAVEAVKSNIF